MGMRRISSHSSVSSAGASAGAAGGGAGTSGISTPPRPLSRDSRNVSTQSLPDLIAASDSAPMLSIAMMPGAVSHTLACVAQYGFPDELVGRGGRSDRGVRDIAECLVTPEQQAEAAEDAEVGPRRGAMAASASASAETLDLAMREERLNRWMETWIKRRRERRTRLADTRLADNGK